MQNPISEKNMAKDIEELMLAVIDAPRPENLAELKKAVEYYGERDRRFGARKEE